MDKGIYIVWSYISEVAVIIRTLISRYSLLSDILSTP